MQETGKTDLQRNLELRKRNGGEKDKWMRERMREMAKWERERERDCESEKETKNLTLSEE